MSAAQCISSALQSGADKLYISNLIRHTENKTAHIYFVLKLSRVSCVSNVSANYCHCSVWVSSFILVSKQLKRQRRWMA